MSEPAADRFAKLRVNLSPAHVVRLASFIAQHDIRYYLNGLCVERAPKGDGVILLGCDGHTLGAIHDTEGTLEGAEQVILKLSPALVSAARRVRQLPRRRGCPAMRVLVRGTRIFLAPDFECEGGDSENYVQPGRCVIEGKYVDWRKVLPDFAKLQRGGLPYDSGGGAVNPSYLARLERVVAGDKYPSVVFWNQPGKGGLYVQFPTVPEMLAVIMPMRGDADHVARAGLPPAFNQPTPVLPIPGKQPSDAAPPAGG